MAHHDGLVVHLCDPKTKQPLKHYEILASKVNRALRFVPASPQQHFYFSVHIPSYFNWVGCNALMLELYMNSKSPLLELPILRPRNGKTLTLNLTKWPVWELTPTGGEWKDASFSFRRSLSNEYRHTETKLSQTYEAPGCIRLAFRRVKIFEWESDPRDFLSETPVSFEQQSYCKEPEILSDLTRAIEPHYSPTSLGGYRVGRSEAANGSLGGRIALKFYFREPWSINAKVMRHDDKRLIKEKGSENEKGKAKAFDVTAILLRSLEERTSEELSAVFKTERLPSKGNELPRHILEKRRLREHEQHLQPHEARTCCDNECWRNGEEFYKYYERKCQIDPIEAFSSTDRTNMVIMGISGQQTSQQTEAKRNAEDTLPLFDDVTIKRRRLREIEHQMEMSQFNYEKERAEEELAASIRRQERLANGGVKTEEDGTT